MFHIVAFLALAAEPPPLAPVEKVESYKFTVQGELTAEAVKMVVKEQKPAIVACYTRAVEAQGDVGGRVTVQWVIGPLGTVIESKYLGDELSSPSLDECLLRFADDKKNKAAELCIGAKKRLDNEIRPQLGKCLAKAVREWMFEAPKSGAVTVTYPFALGAKSEKYDFTTQQQQQKKPKKP